MSEWNSPPSTAGITDVAVVVNDGTYAGRRGWLTTYEATADGLEYIRLTSGELLALKPERFRRV